MREEIREIEKAVDFLYEIPKFTEKHSLSHTKELMRLLGSPAEGCRVIHVAGSNGKGSVCSFLSSMLLERGKTVGLFTSPHLVDIRERFRVNGELCSEEAFLESFYRVRDAVREMEKKNLSHPTFFEYIFAMGMVIFEMAQVEYVILETGLGGRLDATNIFSRPAATVIASVSLEHTEYLGDTVEQIAWEKAGIIKHGVPVVFDGEDARVAAVIRGRARELSSPYCSVTEKMCPVRQIKNNLIDFSLFTDYDNGTSWQIAFSALYQVKNAALAITALRMMREKNDGETTDEDAMRSGLLKARWPGRMQEILPGVWLDGAHNPAGIEAFSETVRLLTKEDAHAPLLLFSMVRDKDYRRAVRLLTERIAWERMTVATIPGERGISFAELQKIFEDDTDRPVTGYADYRKALSEMIKMRKEGQKLFCTGSLYFIGALTEVLKEDRDD